LRKPSGKPTNRSEVSGIIAEGNLIDGLKKGGLSSSAKEEEGRRTQIKDSAPGWRKDHGSADEKCEKCSDYDHLAGGGNKQGAIIATDVSENRKDQLRLNNAEKG